MKAKPIVLKWKSFSEISYDIKCRLPTLNSMTYWLFIWRRAKPTMNKTSFRKIIRMSFYFICTTERTRRRSEKLRSKQNRKRKNICRINKKALKHLACFFLVYLFIIIQQCLVLSLSFVIIPIMAIPSHGINYFYFYYRNNILMDIFIVSSPFSTVQKAAEFISH